MKKYGFVAFMLYLFTLIIIIPFAVTTLMDKKAVETEQYIKIDENTEVESPKYIITYSEESNKPENTELEEYIKGVVAAEMPVSFENEALKAQAVASRTYAVRQTKGKSNIKVSDIGQAYISKEEMKKRWGDNFEEYYKKVCEAVDLTKGEIMVYKDEPILAAFHSTSRGFTEASENVWTTALPYLKSVESKDDENAPNFIFEKEISTDEFLKIIKANGVTGVDENNAQKSISIKSRTDAGYVSEAVIGGKSFSGREIRTMFSLRSTDFTIKAGKNGIVFVTRGYGHGAGMSQYGAEFMAKDGKSYKEILEYYYSGIEFAVLK